MRLHLLAAAHREAQHSHHYEQASSGLGRNNGSEAPRPSEGLQRGILLAFGRIGIQDPHL